MNEEADFCVIGDTLYMDGIPLTKEEAKEARKRFSL
jgi:hypothetical protein